MRNILNKGIIVVVLGLVLFLFIGISAGQDSAGRISTGPEGIITNTTHQEIISAIPNLATAEFRIIENVEIDAYNDIIPSGTFSGRQWGDIYIKNTQDSSQSILGTISETMGGDSFIQPEFPENATWNNSFIHWIFPADFVLRENDSLSSSYHTSAHKTIFNPITFKRYVNRSIFLSDSYQFNSYELNFEENTYDRYGGIVKYEENFYSNSSILYDTFYTDLPLTDLKKGSYLHPITKQYISEINFTLQNSLIQLHHPYHINFTAAIKLRNNAGSPVKCYPRAMFALTRLGPNLPGETSLTASMPSSLLPAHVTSATATTNVINSWQYRNSSQLKLAFKQATQLIEPEKIGIFRPSNHMFYLKNGTATTVINWGTSTDLPVTGDWNGDGKTDVGVYRPSVHTFYLRNGTTTAINWGASTDLPVTGDWNGDRITEIGVYRPSAHTFYLKNGTTTTSVNWGTSTDLPVTGDWNRDGRTDVGVYRPSAHMFYLKNGTTTTSVNWGMNTDKPVTGKW